MLHKALARSYGQSLPLVVLMLALIFLVIGLGIDGGLMYAQRRLMQNTADAACLAAATQLAIGGTNVVAHSAAATVISQNLGPTGPGTSVNAPGTLSYTNITDVYTPTIGAGLSLTRGIETNGPEVRVALTSPAYTYFMRVFGQVDYSVAARARCDATAGGGGTPFAVARWRRYDAPALNDVKRDLTTDQSIPSQLTGSGSGDVVRDILARYNPGSGDPSRISNWPGWGTSNYPGDPTLRTGLFSQPTTPATPANPGIETTITGSGAEANQNGGGYRGAVLLDLRNLTFPNPEFYGGLDTSTSANTYKDFITRYILEGYDGPWIDPGTQLAYISGVTAGQVVDPFDLRYTEGQTVTVLIYNGTIYQDVNFNAFNQPGASQVLAKGSRISFSGDFPDNCDIGAHANEYVFDGTVMSTSLKPLSPQGAPLSATYGVQVVPDPTRPLNMRVRAFSSVDGEAWNQLRAQWRRGSAAGGWIGFDADGLPTSDEAYGVAASGTNLNVSLQQSEMGTCTYPDPTDPLSSTLSVDFPVKPREGALSLYLESRDTQTGLRRGRYVRANLGVNPANVNSEFYAYLPGNLSFNPIERDTNSTKQLNQAITLETVAGNTINLNQVGINYTWFTGDLDYIGTSTPQGITRAVNNVSGVPTLQIGISPTAQSGKDYYLRIGVTYQGRTQWVWYYFAVQPPMGNSASISQYVYTLGYAEFRITDIGSNYVDAVAISGLLNPSEVRAGMQPRLVPWQE